MKTKLILPVLLAAVLLSGCSKKSPQTPSGSTTNPSAIKLLVNELPLADRPFTVLVPHASGRIFSFYTRNADKATAASIDLEYQSGDLLKGASTRLETPVPSTYVKAVVLGSCSTGGKCTFDSELKSGTMKFKLNFQGVDATHVLKGDFTFISGQTNLPDGRVVFEPTKSRTTPEYILSNSFGLPKPVSGETLLYPVVISSTSDKNITGTLTINQSDVSSMLIFDGTDYQPLKFTAKDGALTVKLDQKPWTQSATILRDDLKGSQEQTSLYIVGPILLVK